ncbi:sugar transferase [Nocardioides euryhalodurans]|uniref:Sugar transferase n=1 Tax=Nocardioides euryhalodurans TaxID=2518370 RepID=A0A4P7GNP8_9ACTN|nr:sugar transferase [Nocardioides euryhalodurans]QBR93407.1 sugar transferase [Nocardioides euryhalodurans]
MTVTTDALRVGRTSGVHRVLSALPMTALALDLAIISISVFGAAQLRRTGFLLDEAATVSNLTWVGTLIGACWITLIAMRGGYVQDVFGAGVDEYKRVAEASASAAALLGIGCYLAHYPLSRGFFVLTLVVGTAALLIGRFMLRRAVHRARQQGHLRSRALLVGTTASTDDIARVLQRETWLGYEVMGALTPATEVDIETAAGVPVLGNVDEVTDLAPRLNADVVLLTGGGITSSAGMRRTMWALENQDIHVVVAPSMTDIARERLRIRPVGGLPLIHVSKPRTAAALSWAKRAFDVVGALSILALLLPLMVVTAVRVRLHDRGPALFKQQRVGRDGEIFDCLKFRTMVVDAEDRLRALHEQQQHTHGLFKMSDDPRITGPGRLLRRYSIDELPQLWNVVRGEMSLVGPRPPLPSEVATYDPVASRRLRVRPGMTGLWQVSGRSNLSWDEAIRLDVYYVDNWSMLQDVSILFKTVRAVVGSDGAY